MKKYARMVDNKIWETFTPPVGVDISDCFTAELVAQFIECPEYVDRTYTYDGTHFSAPIVVEEE